MNTEGTIYLSLDSANPVEVMKTYATFPVEFLNKLSVSAFPARRLEIKVECPIMSLRNIFSVQGLCS